MRPTTKIVATTPTDTPPSIQGYLDVATCLSGLIAEARRHPDCDAVVVGCFDDTGVDALRCITKAPVIRIGEAAYHVASMIASKFSVVTTLSQSVAGLEAKLLRFGLDRRCASIRASDVPVLDLERGDAETIATVRRQIEAVIGQDGAEC